ncbi:MAG: SDR family oxidoreductase, partial [Anaerolineales bacterium]
DILIANAGQYIRCPINKLTMEIMEQSMAINFYGSLYQVLAVLPHMQSRHSGHIVLMLSMDAKTPLPPDAPYVAAKSAMSGFADVLRQELRGSGIHLTAIYPGRIDTPMIANLKFSPISAKIPPQTVARAILRCIEHRRARLLLPPQVHLLNILNFFSPTTADLAVRLFRLEGWEEN